MNLRILLRVAMPAAIVLFVTIAAVLTSLNEMAGEVNRIDDINIERSVASAVSHSLRHVAGTHEEYAHWDEAVRKLSGKPDDEFVNENFLGSTETAKLFDTAYLIDADGHDVFALHGGKVVQVSSVAAFGDGLGVLRAGLPANGSSYSVKSGLVDGAFGLMEIAVGPVVPSSPEFQEASHPPRLLVIGRSFDEGLIAHIGDDFALSGLHRVDARASGLKVDLVDPAGRVLGALAWSPSRFGNQAHAKIKVSVETMLLLLAVTTILLIVMALRAIRKVQRSEEQARHDATHDFLTGLPNRPALVKALSEAIERHRVGGAEVALLYADLDGFKQVNDAYGHGAGDRLLGMVAEGFRSICGDRLLARVGGDEFAALIEGKNVVSDAKAIGREMGRLLRPPLDVEGRRVKVSVSIGIANLESNVVSAEELLRRADVTMYEAKQYGGSRVFVYRAGMDAIRQERLAIAGDLRAAIGSDALTLDYQPIFDAATREVAAVEALLRWVRPNHGAVPPSVFVPIAEEYGLMDDLGAWALRQACRDALPWWGVRLAVNVSAAQLQKPDFTATVSAILGETGLPPGRLEIELTETYLVTHTDAARQTLDAIRSLGVATVLDDFGTGYSSIGYLRRFKFDRLKLDRSLIAGIVENPRVQSLVQATVALGRSLNLIVTAEGVENEGEATLLRLAGCREFQGFFFAHPCTAEEFTALYRDGAARPAVASIA
ncbi:MAG: EAL domain-containing protein [Bauldia sp.]